MALVTNMITKILSDYENTDLLINSALKYRFPTMDTIRMFFIQ